MAKKDIICFHKLKVVITEILVVDTKTYLMYRVETYEKTRVESNENPHLNPCD